MPTTHGVALVGLGVVLGVGATVGSMVGATAESPETGARVGGSVHSLSEMPREV